jgi:hypothetical protein
MALSNWAWTIYYRGKLSSRAAPLAALSAKAIAIGLRLPISPDIFPFNALFNLRNNCETTIGHALPIRFADTLFYNAESYPAKAPVIFGN